MFPRGRFSRKILLKLRFRGFIIHIMYDTVRRVSLISRIKQAARPEGTEY